MFAELLAYNTIHMKLDVKCCSVAAIYIIIIKYEQLRLGFETSYTVTVA